MSEIRVNNITNRSETAGPSIAGIPVVNSDSYFVVPTGRTGQRYADDGENIVRDGLVLYLDAKYSYPSKTGIGTTTSGAAATAGSSLEGEPYTWYDMSGNENHGQLLNGVGYNASNGGSLVFGGTNSIVSIPNPLNQSNLSQVWTVSAWIKNTTKSTQTLIAGLNLGLHLSWFGNGSLLYLNDSANDYYTYGSSINNTGWCLITYRFRNSDGSRTIYRNTTNISTAGPNNTSTPYGQASTFIIGSGQDTMEGNISQLLIYNRYISDAEVSQNYNATKGRFGL